MNFEVNKLVGKPLEFKGLKGHYFNKAIIGIMSIFGFLVLCLLILSNWKVQLILGAISGIAILLVFKKYVDKSKHMGNEVFSEAEKKLPKVIEYNSGLKFNK